VKPPAKYYELHFVSLGSCFALRLWKQAIQFQCLNVQKTCQLRGQERFERLNLLDFRRLGFLTVIFLFLLAKEQAFNCQVNVPFWQF
jgi:hypothetical protein